jgi:hypothetical protein
MRSKVNRRGFLRASAGVAVGVGVTGREFSQDCIAQEGTVRDRLWLFGIPANINFMYTGRRSLMTPIEGAYYLGIPNTLMIQANVGEESKYGHFDPPFDQYAIALRSLKRVAWSITGSGGVTSPEYRAQVLNLSKRTPNFVGLYMDDFFTTSVAGRRAVLTLDELRGIRQQAQSPRKKLNIWATYYTKLLDLPLNDYLDLIDMITMWTGRHQDLADLEKNFDRLDKLVPGKRKALGCYFFDFGERKPVPTSAMQFQCETGLTWLHERRIEAMVFLGNSVEDLGYESVEWTRDWIQKVGDTRI